MSQKSTPGLSSNSTKPQFTRPTNTRGRTPQGDPNPIDVHVGFRMKLRRTALGWSQEKLAARLGLTFQQVQKYERGQNRISASRMWDVSKTMKVPINFFFDEMDHEDALQSPRMFSTGEAEAFDEMKLSRKM